MYKVIIKRYGYPRWNGHEYITKLVRQSIPDLSPELQDKYYKDNQDFISTIKTLGSTTHKVVTDEEAATGLSWITEVVVGNEVDANAVKEYYSVTVQARNEELAPNAGLLVTATVEPL
jgi:hypothetical protein